MESKSSFCECNVAARFEPIDLRVDFDGVSALLREGSPISSLPLSLLFVIHRKPVKLNFCISTGRRNKLVGNLTVAGGPGNEHVETRDEPGFQSGVRRRSTPGRSSPSFNRLFLPSLPRRANRPPGRASQSFPCLR